MELFPNEKVNQERKNSAEAFLNGLEEEPFDSNALDPEVFPSEQEVTFNLVSELEEVKKLLERVAKQGYITNFQILPVGKDFAVFALHHNH